MRLATKGRFAVTAMIDIAMHDSSGPVNLLGISRRQKISASYLEQLIGQLRRHELVQSSRGPGGGYKLARPLNKITVAEIIEAVDDPWESAQCFGNQDCSEDGPCLAHELWSGLKKCMFEHLNSVTLAELVRQRHDVTTKTAPKRVSVLREHPAAFEYPTSTLQPLRLDGTRLTPAI